MSTGRPPAPPALPIRAARALAAAAFVAALIGCAGAPPPVPEGYAGPTAIVSDSYVKTGGGPHSGTIFFSLAEVDGGGKLRTSADQTRMASIGLGPRQRVVSTSWKVKAGPARLKLIGHVTYGAPIQSLFSAASDRSVSGVVDVDLRADGRYVVKGMLDAYRREVWIEDADSGQVMGRRIVSEPDAAALARSTASGKFTCCNLHYDDGLISDENFTLEWPMIDAGARVAVTGFRGNSADVIVDGRPMVIDVYLGKELKPERMRPQELAARYVVDADPRIRLATYPADVQRAIRAGKVAVGMTREQVLMSLGYPWPNRTPTLDAKRWIYYAAHDDENEYAVVWGEDGRVAAVDAPAEIRTLLLP